VYDGNREQDFDMHGTKTVHHWEGGSAGGYANITGNTFLAGKTQSLLLALGGFGDNTRDNFLLRGEPCYNVKDQFNSNVTMNFTPVAIVGYDGGSTDHVNFGGPAPSSKAYAVLSGNHFVWQNPADHLAVGDFDGDGSDDLFLATGAAWYYSPGGTAEWRFLNARPEPMEQLLFGDFDGDGRADVVTAINGQLMVSWGGISDWELLNNYIPLSGSPAQFAAAMAVGNFTGDERSDLFLADGKQWWVSDAGQGLFTTVQTSVFETKDLRFGDFNGDGRTDVFSVGSKNWQVSFAPAGNGEFSSWQPLRSKLTDSADGLIVADFDGDGIADVAMNCSGSQCWKVSSGGRNPWPTLPQPSGALGPALAAVGRFSIIPGHKNIPVEILTWDDNILCSNSTANELCISHWGGGVPVGYSVQKMR
jgi:hypothetical protein